MEERKKFVFDVSKIDKSLTKVNKHKLDDEWERHPNAVEEYGDYLVEAIRERDYVAAEITEKLREEEPKISQSKLEHSISVHSDYIKINYIVNKLKSFTEALRIKTKSLERLAELWLGTYWRSAPKDPKTKGGKYEKQLMEKRQQKMTQVMNDSEKEREE